MKVSELDGIALAAACALAEGFTIASWDEIGGCILSAPHPAFGTTYFDPLGWEQGGPLIERNDHLLPYCTPGHRLHLGAYSAQTPGGFEYSGSTPLIAAMRAFVASKLGPEVDLPT